MADITDGWNRTRAPKTGDTERVGMKWPKGLKARCAAQADREGISMTLWVTRHLERVLEEVEGDDAP